MDMMIDVFPLILLLIAFTKVQYLHSGWNADYVSRQTSISIKGIACIAVLLHHLSQETANGFLFPLFTRIGYLPVAVFFFYSGYGLQKRNLTDPLYYKHFGLKRIPNVLFPYTIVALICFFLRFLTSEPYTVGSALKSLVSDMPIVSYSWYVIAIITYYFVFDVLVHVFRQNSRMILLGTGIFSVLWIFACRVLLHRGEYWYNSIFLLVVGVFWAFYEKKLLQIFLKNIWGWMLAAGFCFLLAFLTLQKHLPAIHTALVFVTPVLFVLLVCLILLKFRVGNPTLQFLGDISFEIYLLQGIFIKTLRSSLIMIENDAVYCILVICTTIASAAIFHILFRYILRQYRNLLRRYIDVM